LKFGKLLFLFLLEVVLLKVGAVALVAFDEIVVFVDKFELLDLLGLGTSWVVQNYCFFSV
jgi:hypothetical protein